MAALLKVFVRGLVTLLPISICIYVLYWFFTSIEGLIYRLALSVWPSVPYLPGMGILMSILLIFSFGLLMGSIRIQHYWEKLEMPFNRVPLVKSVYGALRDLVGFFSPNARDRYNQVVRVKHPDLPIELIGFVTNHELSNIPEGVERRGKVAVYLPLSYQIGGITVFIPEAWLVKLNMSVEAAMRSALTAWMPGKVEVKSTHTHERRKKSDPE